MPTSNVFISYSHDSVEHEERLLALAERLRSDGVDANSINTAGKAVNPPNVQVLMFYLLGENHCF